MYKSAFVLLFTSSMNAALAEEATVSVQPRHSRKVTAIVRPPPFESQQAPPLCDDQACGLGNLEDSWKRGILPSGFKASSANDFTVENAGSVIRERANAAETEKKYETRPLKLTYKFLGMDCEIGSFTVGSSQEGGTRCPF